MCCFYLECIESARAFLDEMQEFFGSGGDSRHTHAVAAVSSDCALPEVWDENDGHHTAGTGHQLPNSIDKLLL